MEALQESIAETLSDYEVAEKIWSNRSNRVCADCKAINPDWASINLCVVICKNCAGMSSCWNAFKSQVTYQPNGLSDSALLLYKSLNMSF